MRARVTGLLVALQEVVGPRTAEGGRRLDQPPLPPTPPTPPTPPETCMHAFCAFPPVKPYVST